MIERAFQTAAVVLAAAFLASGILFLCQGHVTVTVFDMWHLYGFALNHPLQAVLTKYGSHSFFFPTIIWLTDITFFGNNQELLFLFGLTLLILTAIVLLITVWRDDTISRTAKIAASVVIVTANFSMSRASITSIGPFNCICSPALLGAVVASACMAAARAGTRPLPPAMILMIIAGFVSSFSFGSGFAVWPTLLFLGWSARLSWRALATILVAGVIAVIVYLIMPGAAPEIAPQDTISTSIALRRFCSLLGTPFLYAVKAWSFRPLSIAAAESSSIPVACGAVGLVFALAAALPRLVRRDLGASKLRLIGLALTTFNFIAIGFIVAGRTAHMHASASEVVAPRYMFWSSLFWAGLFLVLVQWADAKRWARWPVFSALSLLPILVWPQHYQTAAWAKYVHLLMESAATSLVNGVCDTEKVVELYRKPDIIYALAQQYRQKRLDMFAAGVQDWIGRSAGDVSGARYRSVRLKGNMKVQSLVHCEKGPVAARITGWAIERERYIPKRLVFLDPTGTVCGLARPTEIRMDVNSRNKLSKFTASGFLGYIRDYNPETRYTACAADDNGFSRETLPVEALQPTTGDKRFSDGLALFACAKLILLL
jgi:hypothetical protein